MAIRRHGSCLAVFGPLGKQDSQAERKCRDRQMSGGKLWNVGRCERRRGGWEAGTVQEVWLSDAAGSVEQCVGLLVAKTLGHSGDIVTDRYPAENIEQTDACEEQGRDGGAVQGFWLCDSVGLVGQYMGRLVS